MTSLTEHLHVGEKSLLINAHLHDCIGDDPGYGEGLLFHVNFTNTDLEK